MAVVEGASSLDYDHDFWVAVVAGERAWVDARDRATNPARIAGATELTALGATVAILWVTFLARSPMPHGVARIAPLAGSIAALALASRPFRLVFDVPGEASVWRSIAWRSVSAVVLVAALLTNDPGWGISVLGPFGVAAGAEAVLAAWQVGLDVNPWRWWLRFLRSGAHAGMFGSLVAYSLWSGLSGGRQAALHLYLLAQLVVISACLTAAVLDRERRRHARAADREARAVASAEHRRTAHWLHDDVTAQLRILGLRIESGRLTDAELVGMLAELEQHLRVRQLEVVLESGAASLAELLQPSVRDAQRHRVTIRAVPTFDDASLTVSADVGRRFARAAGILTANAIQAGATSIGYGIEHDDRRIRLRVTDDAPWFDLGDVPAGRALWSLRQELGPDSVAIEPEGSDKAVVVLIPRDRGGATDGTAPAR